MKGRAFFRVRLVLVWLLLGCLVPPAVQGQWAEPFSDGVLDAGWQGHVPHFAVTPAGELQLQAPAAGVSRLYRWLPMTDSMRWELYLRLDFSPSATNQLGILLMGDTILSSAASGYYLEVGETGSGDALRFFRLSAGQKTLLASGTAGAMGGNTAVARIRVERNGEGRWTLWSDYSGGRQWQEEFAVTDLTHIPSGEQVFGVVCLYTATRTDKFYFDDFWVGTPMPDTAPPVLESLSLIDFQELLLRFDEPLDAALAGDPERYLLMPGEQWPALAEWSASAPESVRLIWAPPLESFQTYRLQVLGLADIFGNVADTLEQTFVMAIPREPEPGELLIHEIMADPNPTVGLPDAEYVELYHAGSGLLDLNGLIIATNTASAPLPPVTMMPGSYLILTRPEFVSSFLPYGATLGVPSLPALPNDGSLLRLQTAGGMSIHEVTYTPAWHSSTAKREGGWALELVRPDERCARQGLWMSAVAPAGGTPGQPNSVFQAWADTIGPALLSVWPTAPDRLVLTFNERLHPGVTPDGVHLDPAREITDLKVMEDGFRLELRLAAALEPGQVVWVSARSTLQDCLGNTRSEHEALPVGLPVWPAPGDLVINEILFNPPTGGQDFVEIYNASDKVLALKDLLLANMQPGREEVRPVQQDGLIFPGRYAVFTSDTAFVRTYWDQVDVRALYQQVTPAWLNDQGNVTLFSVQGAETVLLDQMDYRADQHHRLLRDVKGVSLERLHPGAPSGDPGNWHSAAEDAGFATPTRRNSQWVNWPPEGPGPFSLEDPVFSPDGDGWRDQLVVRYQFAAPGTILQGRVYDRQGRLVRTVANTQYLGREGLIVWSGDTDEGQPAGVGAYIVWLETYDLNGRVRRYKMPCVLALSLGNK